MRPYYDHAGVTIYHGDCLNVMPELDAVDAIVTDPPYGLGFMGKDWDHGVPGVHFWQEALRVAKPGAHLLAFGGTRTFHRLTCAIEDAGWDIRDCLMWLYGQGFPKSLDVSKAIDKEAGAEREVIGFRRGQGAIPNDRGEWGLKPNEPVPVTVAATAAARQWSGWGTALKPAWEPVIMARKPLEGTVAENVQRYGTGGINVDGCRLATNGETIHTPQSDPAKRVGVVGTDLGITGAKIEKFQAAQRASIERTQQLGRWPANVCLDEEAAAMLDEQSGNVGGGNATDYDWSPGRTGNPVPLNNNIKSGVHFGDSGGASRFFYTAKASRSEREQYLDDLDAANRSVRNDHPTVKPLNLMSWLCRLVTPPGGTVLDPFCGSGTTLRAAKELGFKAIGIDLEERYCEIAAKRLAQEVLPL